MARQLDYFSRWILGNMWSNHCDGIARVVISHFSHILHINVQQNIMGNRLKSTQLFNKMIFKNTNCLQWVDSRTTNTNVVLGHYHHYIHSGLLSIAFWIFILKNGTLQIKSLICHKLCTKRKLAFSGLVCLVYGELISFTKHCMILLLNISLCKTRRTGLKKH